MKSEIIVFNEVSLKISETNIIENLNFSISSGDFTYLIGKTGSGKSSIIRSIYCDIPIQSGKCVIDGIEIDKIKKNQIPFLRRKIGIIFQDFQLLKDRTVYKNLEFVLNATGWSNKNMIKERINSCLEKVHISNLTYKYPSQLSGGQKQKVAIARSLLNEPEIIIADEPTGNLDPKSSIDVMDVLQEINQNGNTIVMATHDFILLKKYKGRILRCKDGKIDEIQPNELNIETAYQ